MMCHKHYQEATWCNNDCCSNSSNEQTPVQQPTDEMTEHMSNEEIHLNSEDREKLSKLDSNSDSFVWRSDLNEYYSKSEMDNKFLTKVDAGNIYLSHSEGTGSTQPSEIKFSIDSTKVDIGSGNIWLEMDLNNVVSLKYRAKGSTPTAPDEPTTNANVTVSANPLIVEKGKNTSVTVTAKFDKTGEMFQQIEIEDYSESSMTNQSSYSYNVTLNDAKTLKVKWQYNGSVDSKTISIKAGYRYYYAAATEYSESIFTDSNSYLDTSKNKDYITIDQGSDKYGWYACPADQGIPTFTDKDSNFPGGWKPAGYTFNKNGVQYTVYVTLQDGLGSTNWKIS